ncbi:MAG: hypothetical protein QS748_10000 [Candidatus Endonucleobacter bathymodioli]|uniref:Uncharacterized protein n=1 Tax=Candidatus Endonucleibacter bathymodioli TaxID=539814 RepID=A0AA90NRY6_9GAMM|nr:hypothetical protein [Candidatus Endonucleobacter bathymodioli]
MRLSIESIILLLTLFLTEAWFLNGYFSGQPDFGPAIAFLVALGAMFTKDKIKKKLGFSDEVLSHDIELFEAFQRAFPVDPTLRLLKEKDFENSFYQNSIQPLYNFVETWDSVEKEFLNKKLEKERKSLYVKAKDLAMEFAKHTVPVGSGYSSSVYPDRLREQDGPRPQHVIDSAEILNKKSKEFTPKYESFVRSCKAVLQK